MCILGFRSVECKRKNDESAIPVVSGASDKNLSLVINIKDRSYSQAIPVASHLSGYNRDQSVAAMVGIW